MRDENTRVVVLDIRYQSEKQEETYSREIETKSKRKRKQERGTEERRKKRRCWVKPGAIVDVGISIQAFATFPCTSFQPQHSEHRRSSSVTLSISNFFFNH